MLGQKPRNDARISNHFAASCLIAQVIANKAAEFILQEAVNRARRRLCPPNTDVTVSAIYKCHPTGVSRRQARSPGMAEAVCVHAERAAADTRSNVTFGIIGVVKLHPAKSGQIARE